MAESRVDFRIGATDAATAAFRSVQRSIDSVQGSYAKLTGVLAGGAAIGGFVASLRSIVNVADEVNKASAKFGVPVESLTSLRFAAQLANVEFGDLETGLKKLSENAAAAAGGAKEQGAVFEAMGLKVKDAAGNLKATDALLREIAEKFEGYADGAAKAALAVEIFGKSGVNMIPLLNNLRAAEKEAKALGAVFSKDLAQASEDFNDNLTRMNALFTASKIAIANDLLPWLNRMLEQMIQGTQIAGGFANAIRLFGLSSITSDNAGQQIARISKEIEGLQQKMADPRFGAAGWQASLKKQIDDYTKQLEFAKVLQRQVAAGMSGGDTPGERARMGLSGLPSAPIVPRRGAAAAPGSALQDKTFENLLQQYEAMVAKAGELTVYEQTVNLLQTQRYSTLTAGERQRILDLAKRVDEETKHAKIVKEAKESELRIQEEAQQAAERFNQEQLRRSDAEAKALESMKRSYEEMADPLAKFARQMAEINRLREVFPQLAETWDLVEQRVLRAASAMDDFKDSTDAVSESAQDMGHAIGTAFEDAVIEMKSAGEVARALAQDFARILLRQAVTKPMEQLAGTFFQNAIGGMFGTQAPVRVDVATPSWINPATFAEGTDYVPRTGFALLHKGEAVVPASENTGRGMVIDARTYVTMTNPTPDMMPLVMKALDGHERRVQKLESGDGYRRADVTRKLMR